MSPLEVLAAELGGIAARIDRDASLRLDAAISDLKRSTAEWELRFERLERSVAERVAGLKDGTSVSAADVAPMIAEAVDAALKVTIVESRAAMSAEIALKVGEIPPAEPPAAVEPSTVADILREDIEQRLDALVTERVALIEIPVSTIDHEALSIAARAAVAEIPLPKDGVDADMDALRAFLIEEVAKIERPQDGVTPSEESIQALVDKAVTTIPPAAPGKDADMDAVHQMIADEVSKIALPKDGETPSHHLLRELMAPIIAASVEALPPAEPGKDADPDEIKRMVSEAVAAIPPAKDGDTPTADAIRAVVEEVVKEAVEALPPATPGKPGTSVEPEEIRAMVEQAVAAIPAPTNGKDGKLPIIKSWEDRVYYEGEVCSLDGATYQASVDTGRSPPDKDWTCIAAKGRDGADALQIDICGTFDAERAYRRLSVVMLNGASFVAKHDEPGPCPGEGWQMMAQQGKRGAPGTVTKADRGTKPLNMAVSDDGVLTLLLDDGSQVECDLYPLLARLG